MIEYKILAHMAAKLAPVPVYMEEPREGQKTYAILEKVGGGQRNHIKTATLAVQSYAPTLEEAAELNERVKAALDAAIELPSVYRAELNSDYNYTDTETRRYRYQAVYDIRYQED